MLLIETWVPRAAKSCGAVLSCPDAVQLVLSSSAMKRSLNEEPTNSGNSSEKKLVVEFRQLLSAGTLKLTERCRVIGIAAVRAGCN